MRDRDPDLTIRPRGDEPARRETVPPVSEARYRALFHAIDEGIALWEALADEQGQPTDEHRLLEANPAWGRMMGLDVATSVGRTMSELFPALEPAWLTACARTGLERVPVTLEHRMARLGRWFRIQVAPLGPPDGRQYVLMAVDITERKRAEVSQYQAEASVREREADLARVQRIGQVGGVTIDIAGGLTGHRSPEYLRLHGLTSASVRETHADWLARLHPDDRERADRTLAEALAGGGSVYASEYRIVRPSDGAVRWIRARADIERDAHGRPTFLFGAHLDVTEQKQLEAELRQVAIRQAFLVRLGDALRPLVDPSDVQVQATRLLGRHLRASRVHYGEVSGDLLRIHPGYADGLPPMPGPLRMGDLGPAIVATCHAGRTAVCTDADADPTITPSQRAVLERGGLRAYVVVPLLKEGEWVAWLAAHSAAPRRWTPEEIALIEATAERTWAAFERARAERALRWAHDELERRVEARTTELALVNAELRAEALERTTLQRQLATVQEDERHRVARDLHDQTGQLLASLSLAVRAVATAGPLPAASSERLGEVQQLADELGRQVHELAIRLRPVALDDLGLVAALSELAKRWTDRTRVPVDLQTVGLDTGRLPAEVETVLYRVVQEALTNTAKHARARLVSVVISHHGHHVIATVEDDGCGFHAARHDAGRLGLRGMRERVTQVGGQLDVESRPGTGTTIIARLPAPPLPARSP